MALIALGALVNDLLELAIVYKVHLLVLTIAVMLLPLGPVTSTQDPQLAASSQAEPEKAVPNNPEGRV